MLVDTALCWRSGKQAALQRDVRQINVSQSSRRTYRLYHSMCQAQKSASSIYDTRPSRFAPRAGLVALRQTFVLSRHVAPCFATWAAALVLEEEPGPIARPTESPTSDSVT